MTRLQRARATAGCPRIGDTLQYSQDCALYDGDVEHWTWEHVMIGMHDEARLERHMVAASLALDGYPASNKRIPRRAPGESTGEA